MQSPWSDSSAPAGDDVIGSGDFEGLDLPPVPASDRRRDRVVYIDPGLLPAAGVLSMPAAVGTSYQGGGMGRMDAISSVWRPSTSNFDIRSRLIQPR
jgi:hypothetical protein